MTDKLRLAIWYSLIGGRNDGPPLYYLNQLKQRPDVEVLHLDPLYPATDYGTFDGHLWVDWGEDGLRARMPNGIPPIPQDAPSIYVSSDGHYSEDAYQYRLSKAREATLTFCNQSWLAARMNQDGAVADWLPHAVEPTAYPAEPVAIPVYDVCWVGHINHPNRAEFLDAMFKAAPNFFFGRRFFEDAAEMYRKSKVVANQALNNDLNMRVFEAAAAGACLLTPAVTDLETVGFEDRLHGLVYHSTEEAVEKLLWALAHDEERAVMGEVARRWVLKRHTYAHRVETVVRAFRELRKVTREKEDTCLSGKA